MSVYSGFATRAQQQKYNNLVQNLLIALKKRVIKFYKQEECDEKKFKRLIHKIYRKMSALEKGKFYQPKYSACFADMISQLNIDTSSDSVHDGESILSRSFSINKVQSDVENDTLRSRAMLQSKKSNLQLKYKLKLMSCEHLSSTKKFNTIPTNIYQNLNERMTSKKKISYYGMNTINERNKKNVNYAKGIQQFRESFSMPLVKDFLPKKEEIESAYLQHEKRVQKRRVKSFRQQKYF